MHEYIHTHPASMVAMHTSAHACMHTCATGWSAGGRVSIFAKHAHSVPVHECLCCEKLANNFGEVVVDRRSGIVDGHEAHQALLITRRLLRIILASVVRVEVRACAREGGRGADVRALGHGWVAGWLGGWVDAGIAVCRRGMAWCVHAHTRAGMQALVRVRKCASACVCTGIPCAACRP